MSGHTGVRLTGDDMVIEQVCSWCELPSPEWDRAALPGADILARLEVAGQV